MYVQTVVLVKHFVTTVSKIGILESVWMTGIERTS